MPPMATVGDSVTFYLSGAGGDSGMVGVDIHQSEDIRLARFLSWDDQARSCLGRIGT